MQNEFLRYNFLIRNILTVLVLFFGCLISFAEDFTQARYMDGGRKNADAVFWQISDIKNDKNVTKNGIDWTSYLTKNEAKAIKQLEPSFKQQGL